MPKSRQSLFIISSWMHESHGLSRKAVQQERQNVLLRVLQSIAYFLSLSPACFMSESVPEAGASTFPTKLHCKRSPPLWGKNNHQQLFTSELLGLAFKHTLLAFENYCFCHLLFRVYFIVWNTCIFHQENPRKLVASA